MKNRIMSIILAGVIAASTAVAVTAEDTATERAKGVVFTAESGYTANTYTGYVGGVGFGTTVDTLLGALENKNGIEVIRDKALEASDKIQHGDKLVLTAEDGTVACEYNIIFMGNADSNDALNLSDVSAMLKKIANWEVTIDEVASDVDGNGAVNLTDVSTALKVISNWNDVTFVNVPVLPGKGDSRVTSVIQTFATGEVWPGSANLRKGQDFAIKFSVAEGLEAKSGKTKLPSWGDAKGSIRISLYKWDTDYETTVASMPIATEYYENPEDGTDVVFSFSDTAGKGVGEGEYLWRFHEGYDERVNPDDETEPVGIGLFIKAFPTEESGLTLFYNGEIMTAETTGDFGGPTEAFGPEAYIQLGKQ